VDNVKIELGEIGWVGIDWIDNVQDRHQWRALVKAVITHRIPQNARKFFSSCTTNGLSRKELV
jgi:hypothetical protein